MHIRIILKVFENYKCPGIVFFSKALEVILEVILMSSHV